jgi:hypothetical protein
MVLAGLIFLASLISVELGISAAIIEIVLGVVAGNFSDSNSWIGSTTSPVSAAFC